MPLTSPPLIEVQDEGTTQGYVSTINAVGAGVVASVSGNVGTLTISGGGGGSFAMTQATVTLPSPAKQDHLVVVTDAAVTGSSKILVTLAGVDETNVNTPETATAFVLAGIPAAGSFTFIGAFAQPISGPLVIHYALG